MSLNSTQTAERVQIGFFGARNAGKSSLINAITNQNIAIVSDIKGTTTDPVFKSMELLPIGPVTLIDTPGFDDEGQLGKLRVEKTKQILNKTDIAVLVCDVQKKLSPIDKELIDIFKEKNIKYIIVYNKSDLINAEKKLNNNEIWVSAKNNINIYELKELISSFYDNEQNNKSLVKDITEQGDTVILVTPIDSAAPKGRLILPQQQVLRELLENKVISIVIQENEIQTTLKQLNKKPKLVITDSQVFQKVNNEIPKDIFLTSFSILFARYKGILKYSVQGIKEIENLQDNDKILISEGCTHHRQCDDIGTVKLPKWLRTYTKKNLNFEFSSGSGFPEDLTPYKMIIHCGGCMLREKEVLYRYKKAETSSVPITNYGITIAYMNKILKRSIEIFPDIYI